MNPRETASGKTFSADENERKLLRALNSAAAHIQSSSHSEKAVYDSFRREFRRLGFRGGMIFISGSDLELRAVTLPERIIIQLETSTGLRVEGFRLPDGRVPLFSAILKANRPVFLPNTGSLIPQVLPRRFRQLGRKLASELGQKAHSAHIPLRSGRKMIGFMSVISDRLSQRNLPALQAFANHIAIALENARLYASVLRSQQEYHRLLQNSRDAILQVNAQGQILFASSACGKIWGYTPDFLLQTPRALDLILPGLADRINAGTGERRAERMNVQSRHKKGTPVLLELTLTPLRERGKPAGYELVAHNITERSGWEAVLQESEEMFRGLAENSPNMIFINQGGRLAYVNKKCEQVIGFSRKEFLSPRFNFMDLIAPEFKDRIRDLFKKHARGQEVPPYEYELVTKRGKRLTVINSTRLIQYKGRPAILGLVTDISDRKNSEKALVDLNRRLSQNEQQLREANRKLTEQKLQLRKGLELYRALVETSPDSILLVDDKHVFRMANHQAARLFGFRRSADLIGKNAAQFMDDKSQIAARNDSLSLINRGGILRAAYTYIRKDKSRFEGEMGATLVRSPTGEPVGFLCMVRDVTDRRKAEQALRESEEKYRRLFNSGTDAIILHYIDNNFVGRFVEVNDAATRLFGYSKAQMSKLKPTDIIVDVPARDSKTIVRKIKETGAALFERNIRTRTGDIIPVEISAHLINYHGRPAVLSMARDIRARRQSEQALRASEREKAIILDSVSEMIIYHDTNLRIIWATRAAAAAVRRTPDALKDRLCHKVIHNRLGPCKGCPVSKALRTGTNEESEIETRSGEIWLIRGYPVRDESGKVFGIVEVIQNITERRKAEDALRESEERYRSFVERANDGIALIQDGVMKFANQKLLTMQGYEGKDFLEKSFLSFIYPTEREKIQQIYRARIKGRKAPHIYESAILRSDGSRMDVEFNAGMVYFGGRRANLVFVRDITERKRAEKALRESEERYRTFVQRANDGIVYVENGLMKFANQKLLEMYGDTKEKYVGKSFLSYIYPSERDKIQQIYKARMGGKKVPEIYEGAILRADGSRMEVEFNAGIVNYGSSQANLVFVRDITERRRAEKALRDSELLNRTTIDSMHDAIHVVDKDLRIILHNRVLSDWNRELGFSGDLIGKNILEAFPFLDSGILDLYSKVFATGQPNRTEDETRFAHRSVYSETDRFPVLENGKVIRVITVVRDVTAHKMAEQEIRQAKEMAESASRAKSDFLTSMSHELRTPLTSILGFAELFQQRKIGNLSDRDLVFVEKIMRNGQHLLTLINSLLDLAKIESGRMSINIQKVNVKEVVEEVASAAMPLIKEKPVKIRTAVSESSLSIHTDPVRLRQVLFNLVGNAVKATEKGRVEITARVSHSENKEISIDIADTGIGIPADRLPGIFDRFSQSQGAAGKWQGTGIGLAISKSIIELLGGRMEVRSEVNRGSVFTLHLPQVSPQLSSNDE